MALVKRFDNEYPERFMEEMFSYLSLTKKEFPVASKMFENPIMDREYFRLLTDLPYLELPDSNHSLLLASN